MSDVSTELNGAAFRITTTRPRRGLDAEADARRQLQPGETAHTRFATVGERGIIDEIRNASGTDIRADMEVGKYAPDMTCIECGHPDFLHDPRGELVVTPVHRPVHRVPGVHPQVDLDERLTNPGYRSESGQFMMALDEADPEMQAAHEKWYQATRRYRPDPNHPANW